MSRNLAISQQCEGQICLTQIVGVSERPARISAEIATLKKEIEQLAEERDADERDDRNV